MSDEILGRIDAKLGALLAIAVDSYLRETGIARPKDRSIDRILRDAGLSSSAVAALLGKTERAVQLQLQRESTRRTATASRTPDRTETAGQEPS
ncbi:MAG TPA: hypothetical protein VII12_11945 [Thermoanaerobaculia bacterium]|jgi:hypothetical protein